MPVDIVALSPEEFASAGVQEQLGRIFYAVYTIAPFYDSHIQIAANIAALPGYAHRPGFSCRVARDRETGELGGFAFGHTLLPGNSWWDYVPPAMSLGQREHWLSDCWALVEFGVQPTWQGQGIGGHLHDTVLRDLPHATAILSTPQIETVARSFYAKRGWQTILTDFHFPSIREVYLILGKELA